VIVPLIVDFTLLASTSLSNFAFWKAGGGGVLPTAVGVLVGVLVAPRVGVRLGVGLGPVVAVCVAVAVGVLVGPLGVPPVWITSYGGLAPSRLAFHQCYNPNQ